MQTTACAQLLALSMKTKSPTILDDCCQAHNNRDGAQHKQGPDSKHLPWQPPVCRALLTGTPVIDHHRYCGGATTNVQATQQAGQQAKPSQVAASNNLNHSQPTVSPGTPITCTEAHSFEHVPALQAGNL
jgi:hypothetical protein